MNTGEPARPIRVIETGDIFPSAVEAAAFVGGLRQSVHRVARGERARHRGFSFEYVDAEPTPTPRLDDSLIQRIKTNNGTPYHIRYDALQKTSRRLQYITNTLVDDAVEEGRSVKIIKRPTGVEITWYNRK